MLSGRTLIWQVIRCLLNHSYLRIHFSLRCADYEICRAYLVLNQSSHKLANLCIFYCSSGPVWDSSTSKPTGYGVKMLTDYLLNVKK